MAIKRGVAISFKTSFAVLGGFTLATCTLAALLDREEPERRA